MFLKFLRETGGNVVTMTALTAPVMLLTAGVGLDMAELYRAKTTYQAAVDAAALAAAKVVSKTGDSNQASTYGEKVFQANIANLPHSSGTININTGNGDCASHGVIATADLRHPMFYDKVHGFFAGKGDADHANISVTSTVQCGSDSVEIAMVLDNSGSMGSGGKLSTLQSASRNLINTIHDSLGQSGKPKPVQFSIVPFTGMVNVGPQNRNASWMDTEGVSPIHHEHFDWSTLNGAVQAGDGSWRDSNGDRLTRFRLYDELNISWSGCVEQRSYPYHTLDTPASSANPASLIVPSFAPDTPDDYTNQRETTEVAGGGSQYWCVQWRGGRRRGQCRRWNDGYRGSRHPVAGYANRYGGDYDYRGRYIGNQSNLQYGNYITEERYENNYLADAHNMPQAGQPKYVGHQYDPNHVGSGTRQYSRQRWMWKYFNNAQARDVQNNSNSLPSVVGTPGGPNTWCQTRSLTPLTTSRGQAISAVNTMQANGSTNVQAGIGWGWRTLSHAAPFSGGRPASVNDNKKIMIVMTDGNNTYYPKDLWYNRSTRNPAYYNAFGFNGGEYASNPLPKRLFEGFDAIANPSDDFTTYRKAMDEHMVETCENAKNAGIQIYSIAFDVANGSSVKQKLSQCASTDASGQPLYYDAQNNAALVDAFASIADRIAELSITH